MDCNAAMKEQATLVMAGKGIKASHLKDSVESACTPESKSLSTLLLVIAGVFGTALFLMFFGRSMS